MNKLPITLMLMNCANDDEDLLIAVLAGAWFCDQKIFVSDGSSERSKEIAREFGCEVYEWLGSDNMSERRNYAVGWPGTDEAPAEWVGHPVMGASSPDIRNEYILQADSDEIYDWDAYHVFKDFVEADDDGKFGCWAVYLKNIDSSTGQLQSIIPLERMFRKSIHWEGEVHNNPMVDGQGLVLPVSMEHYGYELSNHFKKQWKRLPDNEAKLRRDTTDIQHRAFLINGINVAGGGTATMFDRIRAQVDFATQDYLKSPRDGAWQQIIQKVYRFYWITCDAMKNIPLFLEMIQLVLDDITWHPDVSYWMFDSCMSINRPDSAIIWAERFLEKSKEFSTTAPDRSIEVTTRGKEGEVRLKLLNLLEGIRYESKKDEKKRLKRLARWAAEVL